MSAKVYYTQFIATTHTQRERENITCTEADEGKKKVKWTCEAERSLIG